jgi:hypothetical protein
VEGKYRLIPEEIPPISKATVYENVMDDFLRGKDKACRVEVPKKKPSTIHQGLLKTKRLNPRFANLGIVRRGESIYLRK